MATLNINGRKVKVDDSFLSLTPEQQNATVEEIVASMGETAPQAERPEFTQARNELSQLSKIGGNSGGVGKSIDSFGRGFADVASFGLADEIAGTGNAVLQSLNPFKDYSKGFPSVSAEIEKERAIQRNRDANNPIASTTGRVAGGLAQGVGLARGGLSMTANLPARAGLGARVGAGAAEGALYGGAYGFGSGEGVTDRVGDAVGGAVMGGAIGGAVPVIAEGVKAVARPVTQAIGARMNPGGYATQKIAERLSAANITPEQAARKVDGTGMNLADVGGETTRDLLRTTTNIPGPARAKVTKALTLRQFGQGDRIKDVVRDVFADPDGFIKAGDKLSEAWSKVGSEVYEPALKRKVVWTDRLKQFVDEPIFKRGLAQGVKIQRLEALAEGKPFNPLDYAIIGFNEAGDPIIGGVPNMRTLNVAKKGIDAIIGDMKNPLTGKLTEEGRATNMVQKAFLKEIDSWNPDYQQARSVWGGFAKVKEALMFGQNDALNMSPEAVAKTFKEMSKAEQQSARIGIADAIRKKIDAAGYTNNAVIRVFGSRQNIGVLKAAFPDAESFAEFRRAMFTEARKRATYDAVRGNSTTARQLADMAESGGLKEGFDVARTAVTSGPVTATLQFIGTRLKMLGGMTPEVADQIARRLMTADPAKIAQLSQELSAIERGALSSAQKANAVQSVISRALTGPTVAAISQQQR